MSQSSHTRRTVFQADCVGDVTVIRIAGSMTTDGLSGSLRSAAQEAVESGTANCILDVSAVEEFDVSGLGEILAAVAILSEAGGSLVVARPSQDFLRFFDDADHLTGPCRWFSSIDDAMDAIRKGTGSFVPDTD